MEILNKVVKKSLIVILPVAAVSAFFEWRRLPLGIITGGVLGILNFRGLVRNVKGLIGSEGLSGKIIFLSLFRLLLLFTVIFILSWLRLINVFGLIFGFTVVFVFILLEGREESKSA